MTEEQIRAIVRDEIEAECIRPDGIYDKTRQMTFTLMRSVAELLGKRISEMWGPIERGDRGA